MSPIVEKRKPHGRPPFSTLSAVPCNKSHASNDSCGGPSQEIVLTRSGAPSLTRVSRATTAVSDAETYSSDRQDFMQGLIPRTVKHLFDSITKKTEAAPSSLQFTVWCSYMEIYNETLRQ